ncbi:hypothetical protein SELMODRAFT_80963 [Selaginella moellendorffii]|uniref:NADP-dependent oxidoreductase domain-containing protein n=1 Tax=Selaginella moellendorffii TaxID=88036 RepID=D8R067_SELML|nr:hypothetical protein SELMODRAFT_80963 [Selaginella moellendorffii]
MEAPFFQLRTGARAPAVGFGSGTFTSAEEIKGAVLSAIKLGYRHFDTATAYGTETAIGEALAIAFDAGLVTREEVFLTTKLRSDDHAPQDVLPALKKSLRLGQSFIFSCALRVDFVDLFLMHAPIKLTKGARFPPKEHEILPLDIPGTWKAMEDRFDEGLAKAIGVSNFSSKKLGDLLEYARIPPAANQVELHPIWQQKKLRDFCRAHDVQVFAWSPLGGLGKVWGSKSVLEDPVVLELAAKHHKSPAQIVLRWLTQIGVGAVVKSYNPQRLRENIQSFDFDLLPEDLETIESTVPQRRLAAWEWLCNSTTSPYKTVQELWDDEI